MSHIQPDMPLAIISNFAEAHQDFLNRVPPSSSGASLATLEAYHADRTLLWAGDPKLVIVSYPIPHADDLCSQFGYAGTSYTAPTSPTHCLSLDILREAALVQRLIAYAGHGRAIQLVPYATTPEFIDLAEILRRDHGLHVVLPESPSPRDLWLRDFVDTKSGFHFLAGRWLPNACDLLPEAYFCADLAQAARRVRWFNTRGRPCIVKPDTGESGIGSVVIQPDSLGSEREILRLLLQQTCWGTDLIVVEEYISAAQPASPSIEVFVPPINAGEPAVTYVCEQLFRGFGDFSGVIVSRELRSRPWYQACVDSALVIARNLQERGYVGHFDLDAAVDDGGKPRLLEINARRTGGTHVHEFARFVFGANYLDHVALLSWESIDSDSISCVDELRMVLGDWLYPIGGAQRGVVITITSALQQGQFGVLIISSDTQDAVSLQNALLETMQGQRLSGA